MNEKSITASSHGMLLDRRRCRSTSASPSPVATSASASRSLYGAQVEEAERVGRAEVGGLLDEAARVGELLDPLARLDREVVPALGADPEVRVQLVVPVVRAAARAGVRVLLRRRLGRLLVLDRDVDLGVGHRGILDLAFRARVTAPVSQTQSGREPGELRLVRRIGTSPVKPRPAIRVRAATSRSSSSSSSRRRPVRLRHEDGELARLDRVAVERHVDGVGALERPLDRALAGAGRPLDSMNSTSGGSRLRAPTSATCSGSTAPSSSTMRSGIPHALPGRGGRGRVQVAVRVDPDDRQALLAGGERLDRADVRAAAAAEDERPVGQLGGEHQRLLRERVGLDHARLGIGQLVEGRLGHRLAAGAPGARNADEAGAELAAAGVALVLRADRDRRQRAAVGTAGAEAAHDGSS